MQKEMDRYESNRGGNHRDAEGGEKPKRNRGLFWAEPKTNRELGHAAQQRADTVSQGNIAKEKRAAS